MRGRSNASDNWRSFPKGPHSFFEEGFVHDKTLTFKAKMQNQNDGVTIKETMIEKTEGLSGAGEIEVWLAADAQRTFSAKIGTTSPLNLQFDNGVRSFKRIKQNLYAGLEVNRSFTENFGRVGLELFKDDTWSINNIFVYNISRAGLTWDGKAYCSWKNWKLNALASAQMGNKPALGQMGLLLRWSQSAKDTLYLKVEREGSNQTPIRALAEGLTFGWNTKVNETQTVGLQTRINLSGLSWKNPLRNVSSVWLGSQWQVNGSKVKVKLRSDLSHAIAVTNKLGSYGQYSLGMEVSQVGSKNKFKFGTHISLDL